jgi:hypothetical protein
MKVPCENSPRLEGFVPRRDWPAIHGRWITSCLLRLDLIKKVEVRAEPTNTEEEALTLAGRWECWWIREWGIRRHNNAVPNAALSGRGPKERQETPRPVPAVRLNA